MAGATVTLVQQIRCSDTTDMICFIPFLGVADGSFCTQKGRPGTSTLSLHAPDKGVLGAPK